MDEIAAEIHGLQSAYDEAVTALNGKTPRKRHTAKAAATAKRKAMHWTQRPENKAKVKKLMRKAHAALHGPQKLHWTQRPENKARLRKILRNATKTRLSK